MKFLTLLSALFIASLVLQMNPAQAQVADSSTLTTVNGASGNSFPKDPNCPTGNCAKNMPDPASCGFNCPTKLLPEGAAVEATKTSKDGKVTK